MFESRIFSTNNNPHQLWQNGLNDYLKVLIVAGGSPIQDSTETLTIGDSSWQTAGSLPYAVFGIRGVSIGNKVFFTGEFSL